MPLISPIDRSQQTDEVRRIREEYSSREVENEKKHRQDLKRLNRERKSELEKVKKYNDELIEEVKDEYKEDLGDRDRKNSQEISKIRSIYLDSLRRRSEEDLRGIQSERLAHEEQTKAEKLNSEQKLQDQKDRFQSDIKDLHKEIGDRQIYMSEMLKKGIHDNSQQLKRHYDDELFLTTSNKQKQISQLNKSLEERKNEFERRLNAYKTETNQKMERLADQHRESLKEHTDKMEQYEQGIAERQEEALRGAKAKITELELRQNRAVAQRDKQQRLDQRHILKEYQAREEDLVQQRDESLVLANQLSRERVSNVVKNLNKQISEIDRRHRLEKSQSRERFQETLAEQEKIFKKQLQLAQSNADARLKRYINSSPVEPPFQEVKVQEEIKNMQESYSQNLNHQKEAQVKLFKEVFEKLSKKMKFLQDSFTKKHEITVDFYESKMQDLEYQHRKEIERLNRSHDTLSRQKEQAAKIEAEAMSQKYEMRMSNQSDLHQREVDRLEKRHQEHLQAAIMKLAAQLKKT